MWHLILMLSLQSQSLKVRIHQIERKGPASPSEQIFEDQLSGKSVNPPVHAMIVAERQNMLFLSDSLAVRVRECIMLLSYVSFLHFVCLHTRKVYVLLLLQLVASPYLNQCL